MQCEGNIRNRYEQSFAEQAAYYQRHCGKTIDTKTLL